MKFSLFVLMYMVGVAGVQHLQGQAVCGSENSMAKLFEKFPHLKADYLKKNQQINQKIQSRKHTTFSKRTTSIYEIPVVIHVLHTGDKIGSIYNPADDQLDAALDYLNEIFDGTHPSLNPAGPDAAGDLGLRFVLAKRDPGCNPTRGINRIDMSANQEYLATGAKNNDVDYDIALKSVIAWDPSKYYNIYVVNKINGKDGTSGQFIAGFAYFPVSSIVDGTVILATQMKPGSKTLPHEIGHAFNLMHPFEGSTRSDICPTGNNDEVDDTDPISYNVNGTGVVNFNCRTGSNACNANLPFNIRTEYNFMNYTNCYTLFTPGQRDRLQASVDLEERVSLVNSISLLNTYDGSESACPSNINFATDAVTLTLADTNGTQCRKYEDHLFYLSIANAPATTAEVTLIPDPRSTAQEGIDYDFPDGKVLLFPNNLRDSVPFVVRIYDVGQKGMTREILLGLSLNENTDAQIGTAVPIFKIILQPNDFRPVVKGTIKVIDIGKSDRAITDALIFNSSLTSQKTQLLYTAVELKAAGLKPGEIKGISLLVNKKTTTGFRDLRIKMAQTSNPQLVKGGAITAVNGATEVFHQPTYNTTDGWNHFQFSIPFLWNGIDNLCVEFCSDNDNLVSGKTDVILMYTDGSGADIGNMAGSENTACDEGLSSVSYYSNGVKPVIRFDYAMPGNPVASGVNVIDTEYLGPHSEVFFYDQSSPRKIIASIKNLSDWNYGCVSLGIDRSGNNTSPFWNTRAENALTDKTFLVTAENDNPTGQYEITLYYSYDEKRVYELASRNSWQNIEMIKTKVPVREITPSNPQYDKVEINQQVQHINFGVDVTLKTTFSSGFSGFSAGILTDVALPVTWLDVKATYTVNAVDIDWQTASEFNNAQFVVEYSRNGLQYTSLQKIAGAGSSGHVNSYTAKHVSPGEGMLYYRIKQVDIDGRFTYSKVVQVWVTERSVFKAAPVPARDFVWINFGKKVVNGRVELLAINGKSVFQQQLQGPHSQAKISMASLPPGVYIVKLLDGNSVQSIRVIKN